MSKSKKPFFKALFYALFFGGLIAFLLYWASSLFFETKSLQTLIKSPDLGQSGSGEQIWPIGSQMPEVEFKGLRSSKVYSLSQDPAPLKIINFWASWCEPCVEEFSSLGRLMEQFDEGQISFVGISEDKTREEAQEFIAAFSEDFQGLSDVHFGFDQDKFFSKKYGVLALPETFLLDKKGKLLRRVSGFEVWDAKSAVDYIQKLIDKQE